jgi:N-acetylmuramoyl-L-alanine amidase
MAILFAILLVSLASGATTAVAEASVQQIPAPTVVLDAGHGGVDAGVIGKTTGVKESYLNLLIVKKLKSKFTGAGFRVVLTRKTQAGLYGLPTKGFKMRDMQARKKIIEEANPTLFISIHQNFFKNTQSSGAIAFYYEESAQSIAFANTLQQSLNTLYPTQNTALKGDYYVLKCTAAPSVLVECGFLSNPQDEAKLVDTTFQEELVSAIFCGTLSYLS